MASSEDLASDSWHDALKLRKLLLRHLQKLHDANAAGLDASHFDAIETCLDRFRLACVTTIFHDFDFAVSQNVEEALWTVHTSIKNEYGRILARARQQPSRSVEQRKVEKLYSSFLSVAHYFYKTYIQRLNARYGIDELKRAAAGILVEQLVTKDTISPVPEALRAKVLTSCHHTLIRLGDLSRYRIQGASHSSSSAAAALTYYSLAHHLEPQSGFALHQMGIVHLNQGNHLEIVYHFYRAWTVDKPHPLAKPNLEREFKSLLSGQPARRSSPVDREAMAIEALTMWFVRLHAHFYKGQENGPKQEELEKEVVHRLEMTSRNATSRFTLLKMALVNIAAHHVSAERYNDLASSLFYQYTTCFNVRFVLILCGLLKAELEDKDDSSTPEAQKTDAGSESFLPVLRIYCLWLAAHREEVFGAADALGVLIPNMTQALARVFTLLCLETYNQESIQTAPYLMEEDIEIRGFLPLTTDRLPEACRVFCDETGNSKPYPPIASSRLTAARATAARTLDILRCAYFFTEDQAVPLAYRIEENSLIFEHRPATQLTQAPASGNDATDPPKETPELLPRGHQSKSEEAQAAPVDPVPASNKSPPQEIHDEPNLDQPIQESFSSSNYDTSCDMDDADSTVINMLTPFLKPPTPQPQQHPRSPAEFSYGMHTSTANEIFASTDVGPTPTKSISSGKFEPLPWGWFNTPNPSSQAQDLALSAGKDAFQRYHGVMGSPRMPLASAKLPEDPFATPGRPCFNSFGRTIVDETATSSSSMAGEQAHRERLLQSFGASGQPRTSAFSQWAQHPNPSRHSVPISAGWDPRAFDSVPLSSGTSTFSPSSSLYHGTPMNGAGLNGLAAGHVMRSGSQDVSGRESGQLSGRQFQVDRTTSNYDEAILKAAYLGRR
ncbi:Protein SMG7 [Escovopsis weberi]|uniref:Nonsense-mediated mRNA decay factor n=1 Tax=Escovopsis weberi TaxID=150374 RepID=A0A0M8MSQ7_ESCWE|nr:Protein SMG7 [Escovopsis weberi]